MNEVKNSIKIIIIGLVIYSVIGLFLQFVFSFGNQSSKQENQLTMFNFAIPCLITLGFMVYGSILFFKKPQKIKSIWIILCLTGIFEIITIKWQIVFSIWAFGRKFISEMIPVLTGLLMTIYLFFTLIRLIFKNGK